VYFLATYDVGPDGRMRFAVTPKYESVLNALIRKGSPADVRAHCRGLSSKAGVSYAEFASYFRFVRRKIRLGHARNGVILAWDEFVNSRGDRTGEPDDDLVR
jgi:hypothetical protein